MRLSQRQAHDKDAAFAHFAYHANFSMVQFNQFFGKRQSDTASRGVSMSVTRLVKPVKDVRQVFCGNTDAGVAYTDFNEILDP